MRDWDWDYGASEDPEYRRAVVAKHLARLQTTPPESPAEAERKAKQAKDQLAKHDALFGNYPGASIPDIYKVKRPQVSAGDPEGDADLA